MKTKQGTITTHVADDARKWALITFRSTIRGNRSRRVYYHKLALALFAQGLNPWLGYGNETILLQVRVDHLGKVKRDLTTEIVKLDSLKSR